MSRPNLGSSPETDPERDAEIEASRLASLIATEVPRLRRYATAWTGDFAEAEALVATTVRQAYQDRERLAEPSRLRTWLFWWLRRVRETQPELKVDGPVRPRFGARGRLEEMIGYLSPVDAPQARLLVEALSKLGEVERQVVLLVDLEGLSYREVAEVLAMPLGHVLTSLAEGRERLRLLVEEAAASDGDRT